MSFKEKYLKYKIKYLTLKKEINKELIGGTLKKERRGN